MAEYIDRKALLHDIEETVVFTTKTGTISAEMRGAHKIVERIKLAPTVCIHEPTKSEFKRLAVQLGYAPVVHGRWVEASLVEMNEHGELIKTPNEALYCTNCKNCFEKKHFGKIITAPTAAQRWMEVLPNERNGLQA